MVDNFNSITQYDKSFDKMFKNISKKGFACSYFAILSCWRFIQTGTHDKHIHEENIRDGIKITKILDLSNGLSFEDLIIGCTTFDNKKIMCTSVDLFVNNVIGINDMFPNKKERYAVMFLKSEKYFVVLVENDNYYLRDCHVDIQYNFKSVDLLYLHLINHYQFAENINVSGIDFDEYSSIEYLIFDEMFDTDVIMLLSMSLGNSDKADDFDYKKYQDFDENNNMNHIDYTNEVNRIIDQYDLHKNIFDLPEKVFFTDADIEYLDTLCKNIQTNSANIINITDAINKSNIVEQNSGDEFVKKYNHNEINIDELVEF